MLPKLAIYAAKAGRGCYQGWPSMLQRLASNATWKGGDAARRGGGATTVSPAVLPYGAAVLPLVGGYNSTILLLPLFCCFATLVQNCYCEVSGEVSGESSAWFVSGESFLFYS